MRVVLATSSFCRDGGGIASYAREFCSRFLQMDHQMLVITNDEGDITRFEFASDPRLTCISCPIPKGRSQYTATAMRLH